jgi:hypothetical protein
VTIVRRALCLALLFTGAAAGLAAAELQRFELSVLVDGCSAEEYPFRDRTYIEALRGESFALRLHNPTAERVAVALSVDGLNVLDAKRTTAADAAKWILAPGQTLEIPGWQVSGETSRRFFFTDAARSYAKWIGDTRNVGTIEAVFFREKTQTPHPIAQDRIRALREEAASGVEGGVPGGVLGGVPGTSSTKGAISRDEPLRSGGPANQFASEADRFAATGIGARTRFAVRWVSFEEDPIPAASISLRYEYRRELVRLGALSGEGDLHARDRGRGFEHSYAPDPDGSR